VRDATTKERRTEQRDLQEAVPSGFVYNDRQTAFRLLTERARQ
jgi:hypothetical protein